MFRTCPAPQRPRYATYLYRINHISFSSKPFGLRSPAATSVFQILADEGPGAPGAGLAPGAFDSSGGQLIPRALKITFSLAPPSPPNISTAHSELYPFVFFVPFE
jgi:hypothetical protein